MEQKRRAVELETQEVAGKADQCERDIHNHRQRIIQLSMDNKARRDVLDETQNSLTELGNMLQDLKHTTEKMRQLFWEQEKKIEYLKRDLSQVEEQRRQKVKE